MPLETGSFIADLTAANPTSTDPVGQGDDHLRLIKTCLQGSFPNLGSIFGQVRSQDTAVSLSSTWNNNTIFSTNSATSTVVLTLPPAASITNGFTMRFVTGPSANISLLPSGAATVNGGASFAIGERNVGFAVYAGSSIWRAGTSPTGESGSFFSGLTVSGATQLNGSLSVSGATTLASLTVSASTILNGALQANLTLSVSGAAIFKGAISVSGVAILNGGVTMNDTLSVSGAFHAKTTASFGGAVALGTTLTVSGATTLQSTLSVSGAAHFNTTLSVGGTTSLGGILSVSGATHLQGPVSISGAVAIASTLTVGAATSLLGTLSVAGATLLGTTLTVSGAATLQSTLSVSGAFHAKTTASFGGAVTLGTTLSVSGAAHFHGALSVSGNATFAGNVAATSLQVNNTVSISGTVVLTIGQIVFPAAQVASAGANTLDDYEEGTFTPALTFQGPGDQSITYSTQAGNYTKIGRMVQLNVVIVTTGFAHTTSTGNLQFNGPFTAANLSTGAWSASGFTMGANYTAGVCVTVTSSVVINFQLYGPAAATALATLGVTHHVTGNNVVITMSLNHNV